MPVKIETKARFRKDYLALDQKDQESITEAINRWQAGERVNLLRINKKIWRLKVGDWRIFLTFSKELVELLSIERRTTTTYRKR